MAYELNEKRSPTYLLPITAADANPIPEKREPTYVVFIDADGNPIDMGGGSASVTWASITGKPAVIAAGATASAARTAIGALAEVETPSQVYVVNSNGGQTSVTYGATGLEVLKGATPAAVRTEIGAGTSNLAIGTTASTAAAGNHNHAVTADATSGLAAAANIQALAVALSARIKALEDRVTTLESAGS